MNEGQGTAEQTPGKRRRKWPCLLCGFLCGFGITVLAVVVFAIAQPGPVVPEGTSWEKSVADALLALWIALIAGMIGMLVGVIIYDRKKIGELPCRCGLRFHGMSMTRCPVCKRPFIRKPVRIPPYLWGGFLWGFGIPAVPTVVVFVPSFFLALAQVDPNETLSGLGPPLVILSGGIGLAGAVVLGLVGMLIGYGIYRWRRR
jgi:ABC-type Fe3+ transport system permease subunit